VADRIENEISHLPHLVRMGHSGVVVARGERWSHVPPIPKPNGQHMTPSTRLALVMRQGQSSATQVGKKSDAGLKSSLRRPIVNGSGPFPRQESG
jgi:hypothetical protein